VGSKVEKSAAGALEGFQSSIEIGFLAVELVDATAKFANLGNQSRIVIEQPRHSVGTGSTRCEQFSGFNEAGFEVEGAAHNLRYIKFGAEHATIRTELNVTSSIMRSVPCHQRWPGLPLPTWVIGCGA